MLKLLNQGRGKGPVEPERLSFPESSQSPLLHSLHTLEYNCFNDQPMPGTHSLNEDK